MNIQKLWAQIKQLLAKAYTGVLDLVKSPYDNLTKLFKGNNDKRFIDQQRQQHFNLIKTESAKENPDFNDVTKKITLNTKSYLSRIIAEEVKKLGKPPTRFTVATFGSAARSETGPITDVEVAFLLEEKSVAAYQYFYQLAQNVSDRFFLLGEHPDIGGKGLRMDEANNGPVHYRFFARNATREQAKALMNDAIKDREFEKIPYEGSRPFIATAEEFADYTKPGYSQDPLKLKKLKDDAYHQAWQAAQKNPQYKAKMSTEAGRQAVGKEIQYWVDQMYRPFNQRELKIAQEAGTSLARNVALLYGDENIFKQYVARRDAIYNQKNSQGVKNRHSIAKSKMVEDIKNILQKNKGIYLTGELGKTLDIKRELYRFPEQFLTNLGLYHECKTQNTIDIAKELMGRGILSTDFGNKLIDFMQFATGLKLKEQSLLKRQGFAAYFDAAEFEEDKRDIEKEIKGVESAMAFLKSIGNTKMLQTKERELVRLKTKYDHLLEMAPGKIYSAQDIKQLKAKLPFAKEIFTQATAWVGGEEKLGFKPAATESKPSAPFVPAFAALQAAPKIIPKAKQLQNAKKLQAIGM